MSGPHDGKEPSFAPLVNVSWEKLVPHDHFYRYLDRTLELSFVRGFVQHSYAGGGRPSIDPVVFFKLQLVAMHNELYLSSTLALDCSLLHPWFLS